MIIPTNPEKFLSSWKYVETAVYVNSISRVIRQKNDDKISFIDIKDMETFRNKHNNTGLYTSIWRYNSTDIDTAIRLSSLYFDIDSTLFADAQKDAILLYEYLKKYIPQDSILIYFTGKKGFHIECEAIALGINPSNNLPNIFRYIAETMKKKLDLKCLDFSVYDSRRMWRLEGSKHQDTDLYKNLLSVDLLYSDYESIKKYCLIRQSNIVAEQAFNADANEWFRQFTYDMEIEKEKSKDFIGYFNKYGSTAFRQVEQTHKEFTPKKLLENCTAVKKLWQQAIEKKYLEHEARLFLCSILTYSEESIEFLHGILSNCDDYNVEKTNSHINDWIRRRQLGIGGRPYTCERANSAGVGCGECSLDKRNKWLKVGDKYVETNEKSSPSPVRFAYAVIKKGGQDV